jgi:hypothetical protein
MKTTITFTTDTNFGAFTIPAGTFGKIATIDGKAQRNHRGATVVVVTREFPSVWATIGREVKVLRSRTGVGEIVHHRVAASTGATIVVERTGPGSSIEQDRGWATVCLNHGMLIIHETRKLAVAFAAVPEEWCGDCERIADGTADRITTGLVR